jgi:hypothetical protein
MSLEPAPPSEQLDNEHIEMAKRPMIARIGNLFFKIEKVKSPSSQFPVSVEAKLSKMLQFQQMS